MQDSKEQLFATLESILSIATDINIMTQNQETIILHGSGHEMLSELASNKQEMILKLNELEKRFESIYTQNKQVITEKPDIERLQALVGKIMESKESITRGEEKNRRLWAGKETPKVQTTPIQKPKSYVIEQYKKHSKL